MFPDSIPLFSYSSLQKDWWYTLITPREGPLSRERMLIVSQKKTAHYWIPFKDQRRYFNDKERKRTAAKHAANPYHDNKGYCPYVAVGQRKSMFELPPLGQRVLRTRRRTHKF